MPVAAKNMNMGMSARVLARKLSARPETSTVNSSPTVIPTLSSCENASTL